jgi:DNA repair protein RadC
LRILSEALKEKGPKALRDSELLAILLVSGYKGKNVLEVARHYTWRNWGQAEN